MPVNVPFKRRVLLYIILAILCKVIPYIVTIILIIVTMDRKAGMKMGVFPGLIIPHLLSGVFFLKTYPWLRIVFTLLTTGLIYFAVLYIVTNRLIVTNWDIYGSWDIVVSNILAGIILWEISYHLISLINSHVKTDGGNRL
jgi:hypothetical protein